MRFIILAAIVAIVLFVGYFSINYVIERPTYKSVVLKHAKVKPNTEVNSTEIYSTPKEAVMENHIQDYNVLDYNTETRENTKTQDYNIKTLDSTGSKPTDVYPASEEIVVKGTEVKDTTEVQDTKEKPKKLSSTPKGVSTEEQIQHHNTKTQGYGIETFAYQLQNSSFDKLKDLNVSLLVIDPEDGDGKIQFTKDQLIKLKENKKYIVAYIDIGEAENWRDYWNDLPKDLIGIENPDWEDVYYVKFWSPTWQNITYNRIQKYLDLGYDGVYLDMIDVYEYWEKQGYSDAKQKAVDFVKEISRRVKARNPNLLVIPQNAVELLKEQDYIDYIDGIGAEETFYTNDKKASWSEWDLEFLDYAISKGKFVLAIDYSKKLDNRCDFVEKALAHKFVPFVGPRQLDSFVHFKCDSLNYSQ